MLGALGSILGTAVGGPMGGTVGGVIGGMLEGGGNIMGAKRSQKMTREAAEQLAEAYRLGSQYQIDASAFTPVGFRSALGGSRFEVDPETGRLTDAGFTLDPRLAGVQSRLLGVLPGQLDQALAYGARSADLADQYFGMGQDVLSSLNLDPTEAAQLRMSRMQEILAPGRAESAERMYGNLAAKGLTGLGVETGTGAIVNPIAAARSAEEAEMDKQIAFQSYDRAMGDINQQLSQARGLFGSSRTALGGFSDALSPYRAGLAQVTGIDDIGMGLMRTGYDLSTQERGRGLEEAGFRYDQLVDPAKVMAGIAGELAAMEQAKYAGYGGILRGGLGLFSGGMGGSGAGFGSPSGGGFTPTGAQAPPSQTWA